MKLLKENQRVKNLQRNWYNFLLTTSGSYQFIKTQSKPYYIRNNHDTKVSVCYFGV